MDLPAACIDQLREIFPSGAPALDEATRSACGYANPRRGSLPDVARTVAIAMLCGRNGLCDPAHIVDPVKLLPDTAHG